MSPSRFTNNVWILGATGRVGCATAARLIENNIFPVLVGRDRERLSQLVATLSKDLRTIVAASPEEIATEINRQQPAVVINTIGPFFTKTTALIVRACLPCSHYIDLAHDLSSTSALLALHEEAVTAGHTLVTGAGFGVLATESVVLTPDRCPQLRLTGGLLVKLLRQALLIACPTADAATSMAASCGTELAAV